MRLGNQNESYKARATKAESELKLKNDQKRNQQTISFQQRRDIQEKIRALDTELKETKVDECPKLSLCRSSAVPVFMKNLRIWSFTPSRPGVPLPSCEQILLPNKA